MVTLSKIDNQSPIINHMIKASEIRLIDSDGIMIGVVSRDRGIAMAEEKGFDLVLISNADTIPVCKITDYGKYKYNLQKKLQKNKKKQKIVDIKEIKIRSAIQPHDYQIKIQKAKEILLEGDKVKFILRLRGREVSFKKPAYDLINKIILDLSDSGKVAQKNNEEEAKNGNFFCVLTSLVAKQ